MKPSEEYFIASTLTLAVRGALVAMLTFPLVSVAADDTVASLTHPTNFVEIGAMNVSQDSAKFGEYNGLDDSGVYAVGNFDVRGGNAYNGEDGTNRWEIRGTDLGTTSREISGTVGNQGQWNLGIGYDELRHNITDSYKTPFQGRMGGDNFNLPESFGIIDATQGGPAGSGTQGMTANQLASFHKEDVHSDRKNKNFNAGYNFDLRWSAQFEFNRLDQSGAKLIGASFPLTRLALVLERIAPR